MKKFLCLLIYMVFVSSVLFAIPADKRTLDSTSAYQGFNTIEVWKGQNYILDVYIEEGGEAYTNLSTCTGYFRFGEETEAELWHEIEHSSITADNGVVRFEFLPSDLNTNGVFIAYIVIETAEGYPFVSGQGKINIEPTTVTGTLDPLLFTTPINFGLWTATGDLDFGGGSLSNVTLADSVAQETDPVWLAASVDYYTSVQTDTAIDTDISTHTGEADAHQDLVTLGAGSDGALTLIGQELTLSGGAD